MEGRFDNRWRHGKTAMECHRYMLENEIATDVCFEVITSDDAIVRIRAHKCMLISRSEVFDAMFRSGMIETQGGPEAIVRIEDIAPDVFRELLRFIYYDSREITATSALELFYAAKKYMLPTLVYCCSDCLRNSLTPQNVCQILNERLLLLSDESYLNEKCIDLVEHCSSEVLKPQNLLHASRQTMQVILQLDLLVEVETEIYNACVNWAKAQLKDHQSIDHPNDQQIREMLGDLIYDIRFPTMDAKAFAALIKSSTVLSCEEKLTILCYIISKHKKETMKFNCNERPMKWKIPDEDRVVDRGGEVSQELTVWKSEHDAILVETDRTILVTGLSLLREEGTNGSGYTVDIEILMYSISIFKMSTFIPYTNDSTPHKVLFNTPVLMKDGLFYKIIADSRQSKTLHYHRICPTECKTDDVTFTFFGFVCPRCNKSGATAGHIPQIYFRGPQ